MRVSRKPDGKSDDMLDPPKEPFEQLATDDVILAKGAEFQGTGLGGVKTHHVVRDLYSGARVAYPLSKRDAPAHAKNFRRFVGLRANGRRTKLDSSQRPLSPIGGLTTLCWKETSGRRRNAVGQSTFNQGYRMSFIPIRTHLRACQCPQTDPP